MKNLKLNLAVFSFLFIASLFTSCSKDEMYKGDDQQSSVCKKTQLVAAFWKHRARHDGCYRGGIFCREKPWWDCLADDDFESIDLLDNEVAGTGSVAIEGGDEVLFFDFTRNNFSEESRLQLLNERVIELEDFEFDKELVNELYQKAGLTYHQKPINIKKGTYEIAVIESPDGTLPNIETMTIQVKIKLKENDQVELKIIIQ